MSDGSRDAERVPSVRVSDEERRAVISMLSRHCADGRLTMYEMEERMSAAAKALTREELATLLADLPQVAPRPPRPPRSVAPPPPPPRPSGAGRGARLALQIHLAVYTVVIAFLVLVWLLTTPGGYFWPVWPALGWGLAVAIHALVTRAITGE